MADGLDALTASAGSGCLCSGPSQDLRKVNDRTIELVTTTMRPCASLSILGKDVPVLP
jgi:hypothetical protein